MNDERFMWQALKVAESNPRHPFGAVIVDSIRNQTVAEGVNQASENPVWHAEIVAIQNCVSQSLDRSQLTLYTTAEPCPMCMAAILWTGIGRVVYGTSISTLRSLGWNQIQISAQAIIDASHRPQTVLTASRLSLECDQLFIKAASL
jgi:tRNA(Arg) A34 adenosine deaminase TadA